MTYSALLWLCFNILSIIVLAFYSMLEMACVSFNKVRLQYYVSKGDRRAIWLNDLLQHPSRLFGTTLIGVNFALVVGSECARESYAALGLSPDLAPLTQVILVVIFGELAPMFAARKYPEHVALLGVPLIYASSKLMAPLLYIVGWTSKISNFFSGKNEDEANLFLTQEELQKMLEEQTDEPQQIGNENAEFRAITSNIFALRNKNVREIMQPIPVESSLPSQATIEQMEKLLAKTNADFVPIYRHDISHIIGIAYPRDALRASEKKKVRDYAWSPWFVSETTSLMQILKQFRTNNENVAFIIDKQGKSIGLITLSDVLEEIFGQVPYESKEANDPLKKIMLIEKTFSGNFTIGEFHAQYGVFLGSDPSMTLTELMAEHLERRPEKEDSIYIPPFELSVKEASLLEIKTISISTINV